jgi:hypothetical protein
MTRTAAERAALQDLEKLKQAERELHAIREALEALGEKLAQTRAMLQPDSSRQYAAD